VIARDAPSRPISVPDDAENPWRDPAGRFSPLKCAVLVLLFVPAVWVAGAFEASSARGR
jgi:hypothetical protein